MANLIKAIERSIPVRRRAIEKSQEDTQEFESVWMESQTDIANDAPMSLAIHAHTNLEDTLILAQAAAEASALASPPPYNDSADLIEDEDEDTATETPYLTAFMRAFHGAGEIVDGRA
ncbi:MAG: hypothetical protein KKA05_06595 [Alphaproteobacteria bacterium]|nr:hypothetical protein [Alphaproteobacteria bacterium]